MTRIVHTSDLHLSDHDAEESLATLDAVLTTVSAVGAQLLILAGDSFDNNRVSLDLTRAAALRFAHAKVPTVILPGNHDNAGADSVYRRPDLSTVPLLHILGLPETNFVFSRLGLTVFGEPHRDYEDMRPVGPVPATRPGRLIAVIHGHWVESENDRKRAYTIESEALVELGADYYALGHWDHYAEIGPPGIPAYYSGSPRHMKTVNVVDVQPSGPVSVRRQSVQFGGGE